MKKILFLLIIPIFYGFKAGQDIDQKKMNRDLEIAKNILATLIKTGPDTFFGGSAIEASYIKDYGVIFTIPEHLVYFYSGPGKVMAIPRPPEMSGFDMDFSFDVDADVNVELSEEDEDLIKEEAMKAKEEAEAAKEEAKNAEKEMKKEIKEARVRADRTHRIEEVYINSEDTEEIDWEEIMVTFLTDYADLIGQLQPDEKIMITQKAPYDDLFVAWEGDGGVNEIENEQSGISAEVSRKDLTAYKSGKIDKETFESKIVILKKEPQKKVADLEMFASIFDRYYSRDLSETFFSEGKPRYDVLDGYGAVFYIKTVSSGSSIKRVRFYSPGQTVHVETDENETSDDAKLYPKFREDIKAFMLDYGRTIRSLNDDDKVLLEIKINSCQDSNIPKTLEVSTKMSLLKKYDQQKISREKALEEIEIKEVF